MRSIKTLAAGLAFAAAASFGTAQAGIDLNEGGAFLVYPRRAPGGYHPDDDGQGPSVNIETFLTITNTSSNAIIAHVSFINGDSYSPKYCYECDFDVPMTGLDTETLVLTRSDYTTQILNLDSGARRACSQ